MRGHFPARSRALVAATALATVPLLGACTELDRARYDSDPLNTGEAAARAQAFADRSRATRTGGGATTTVARPLTIDPNDVSGVVSGSRSGARRAVTSALVVRADPSTCWTLVVDGNDHRGCGNAGITDTRGDPAGRLTKRSGSTPARVSLVTSGQTVDSGQVVGNNRYVTVRG